MSSVHRLHSSRLGQAADEPTGYIPNNALALAGVVAYATIGVALSFRVFTSKAWWGLCLPIGSFCGTSSPTILCHVLNIHPLPSRRSGGLRCPIHVQRQPRQQSSPRHTATIYYLRTGRVPCLQLHRLRPPHLIRRFTIFNREPPKGGKDIRHQRCLHLLDTG